MLNSRKSLCPQCQVEMVEGTLTLKAYHKTVYPASAVLLWESNDKYTYNVSGWFKKEKSVHRNLQSQLLTSDEASYCSADYCPKCGRVYASFYAGKSDDIDFGTKTDASPK